CDIATASIAVCLCSCHFVVHSLFLFFSFLLISLLTIFFFFFFNDTATTEIYTLSLHDALPISSHRRRAAPCGRQTCSRAPPAPRSEEHTSELQSRRDLVCRLLLEKKKKKKQKENTVARK